MASAAFPVPGLASCHRYVDNNCNPPRPSRISLEKPMPLTLQPPFRNSCTLLHLSWKPMALSCHPLSQIFDNPFPYLMYLILLHKPDQLSTSCICLGNLCHSLATPFSQIHGPRMSLQFRLFSRNCCHFRIVYEIMKNIRNKRNFEDTKFRKHPRKTLFHFYLPNSLP
jgi:hypothetical protein